MHKTVHALLALSSAAILASPALATNLVSEPFSYLDGNLVPNGGWATSSGTGTDIQVIGNYAEGDMNQVRADELAFPAQGLTGVTYSSFRVRILQPVSGVPRRNYFAHMKDTGTSNSRAKIWVMGAGSSTTTFYFGVSVAGDTPSNTQGVRSYNTWYTIVTKYDAAAQTLSVWVDPVNESSSSATAYEPAATPVDVSAFALRESNTGTGVAWKFDIDDLGVGTTFLDAFPQQPVPTQDSTWGRIKTLY